MCATDEHGTPIELNAMKQNIKPEEFVKKWRGEHARDFKNARISFDEFHYTHSNKNKEMADYFFNSAKKKGYIYEKEIEATYCPKDKRFLPDRFVKGTCPFCGEKDQYGDSCEKCGKTYNAEDKLLKPKCALCGAVPIQKKTKHFFFKLSSFSKELEDWLLKNKNLQSDVVNYVKNWIKDGLKDWDVTRDGPYFGFKIPGEKNKYYYVWLDAPIGYVSSTVSWAEKNKKNWEAFWKKDAEIYHFIGKDIVYFHYLFWPSLLSSAGFSLPHKIPTRGYLTVNGEKMSKSRGTFILLKDFLEKYPADYLRYYFTATTPNNTTDVDFSWGLFEGKINKELLNDFGNFVHRALTFANNNYGGHVPKNIKVSKNEPFLKKINALPQDVGAEFDAVELKRGLEKIMEFVRHCNKYFNENEPWKKIKEDKKKADEIVYLSIKAIATLSIVIEPVIPDTAKKLQDMLNLKNPEWGVLEPNEKIKKPKVLIEKIECRTEQDPFSKLDIRAAKILNVSNHPKADRLYVIQLDLGSEKRQVVAGLKENYSQKELEGKIVCVLYNLKPAKLRGVESNGMILAADDGEKVSVLFAPKAKPGVRVTVDGIKQAPAKAIDFKNFESVKMEIVKYNRVAYNKKELLCGKNAVVVEKVKIGAKVC